LVRRLPAAYFFQYPPEHGKDLHVTVVVDGLYVVGLQVKGINHIEILDIGRGGFVGYIYRVIDRQVPYGKGLKFSVSRVNPPLVFMIDLREARGHFSAARARPGDDYQRFFSLNKIIGPVSFITDNQIDLCRIAFCKLMSKDLYISALQFVLEELCGWLAVVSCNDNPQDVDPPSSKVIYEFEGLCIIGDAEICSNLFSFNIPRVYAKEYISLILQFLEEPHLDIRIIPGQYPCGMKVKQELSAEFEVEFIIEFCGTFKYLRCLFLYILLIIKCRICIHEFSFKFLFKRSAEFLFLLFMLIRR